MAPARPLSVRIDSYEPHRISEGLNADIVGTIAGVLNGQNVQRTVASGKRVFIGPANSAGQGYAWARAISRHLPGRDRGQLHLQARAPRLPADHLVSAEQFRHDAAWAEEFRAFVTNTYTHAILESNRPVFGARRPDARADIAYLRDAGLGVALMAHGSDVRIPSVFSDLERWSPFPNLDPELRGCPREKGQGHCRALHYLLRARFRLHPLTLVFHPERLVVSGGRQSGLMGSSQPPLASGRRPVVVHAPATRP